MKELRRPERHTNIIFMFELGHVTRINRKEIRMTSVAVL